MSHVIREDLTNPKSTPPCNVSGGHMANQIPVGTCWECCSSVEVFVRIDRVRLGK